MEIIDEIKHLPPPEQELVVRFVRSLEDRAWSGAELTEAAGRMAEEPDPEKAQAMWEQIATGFYGKRPDA